MSKLDKLKKKAAEFEQKRQFDKALSTYEQVLREQGSGEDADVALFNRVGDLQLRHGRAEDALRSYETAVELYAERGFHNNAIALCQKILRQDPHRSHIQLQLGRISALKGIRADARHHFRTYARMMERAGRVDEAVQALDTVSAHSADADDSLLAAADLLARTGRTDDALSRLRRALDICENGARMADAQVVIEQIRAIDPSFEAAPPSAFTGDADIVGIASAIRAAPTEGRRGGVSPELILIDPAAIDYLSAAPAAQEEIASPPDLFHPEQPVVGGDIVLEPHFGDTAPAEAPGLIVSPIDTGEHAADSAELAENADVAAAGPPAAELLAGFENTSLSTSAAAEEMEHPLPFSMTDELLAVRPIVQPDAFVNLEDAPDTAPSLGSSAINDALFGAEAAATPLDFDDPPTIALVEPIAPEETIVLEETIEPPTITPVEVVHPELSAAGPVDPDTLVDMEHGAGAFELIQPDDVGEPERAPPVAAVRPAPTVAPVELAAAPEPVDPRPVQLAATEPAAPSLPSTSAEAVKRPEPAAGATFVNLGDLLRAEDSPRSTRMVTEERAPTGDEQADFVEMLRKFKQGVAENVDHEDFDSHYDLGVAYKEMGLLDEAVAAFQRALRGPHHRVRIYEALGQCFLDKGQHAVANSVLQRALSEAGSDDQQLVGVLYLLGRASEAMNQKGEALRYYQRVFAVDIEFNDVAERIGMVEQVIQ